MNDFRKLFEQTSAVETQNEGTSGTFREKFDQAQAMSNAGDINGIMSLVSANISDPEEAQAVAGMTYTLAKTYNQKPIDILKDLDGWAARYTGTTQPRKTAWKQIQDGIVSGWYTDQLGTYGSALMNDQKPEVRQIYLDRIAEIKARMPNPEGDKGNIGVKAIASAGNLVGTMIRPLLVNTAVTALIPAMKLPMVATELAGAVPSIVKTVASKAVSFGTTWAVTADVEAGNIYLDMLDNGVDEDIAKKYARIHGAIAGALEAAPLEFAFTRFPFLKGATQNAWRQLATNTRTKQALVKTLGGILQKNLISAPMQVLAETATEALQEVSSISFERRAALALADEIKDEKLKKMLPEVYNEWRDLYNKEVGDRQALYEGKDYKDYVADRIWDVVVQTALGTSVLGFAGAAGQTISDARYTSTLRKEAQVDPSKAHFIKKHFNDDQFKDIKPADRGEALAQIYNTQHTGETVDTVNPKTIDTDYVPINEGVEDEEQAQASGTPTQPIKRRKDNRLHTQEMIGSEKNPGVIRHNDGSESHTLLLGTTDTSVRKNNRYGQIDYTISADGRSVTIDTVKMKPGYEDLTGEFVTELMRRYPGLEIEWSPEENQKAIKEQLINSNTENPGKLQMFKREQSDMDRILKTAGFIKSVAPNLTQDEAAVFTEILDEKAKNQGITLDEYITNRLQFKSFEQGIKDNDFSEKEKAQILAGRKKGGFKPMIDATKGIVYVGENGDFSTLGHEVMHYSIISDPEAAKELADSLKEAITKDPKGFRKYLQDHAKIMAGTNILDADRQLDVERIVSEISNLSDDPATWTENQHEIAAVLFETALQEGRTFNPRIQTLMDKIIDFFLRIYRTLKKRSMLNDRIVKAYDRLLVGNPELKAKADAIETENQGTKFQTDVTQDDIAEAERQYAEVVAKYKGTDQWLKAPNGQPTKLTERQWVQVRTPNFIRWFGDWENDPQNASKVVDENGEPKVVYHGTNADFDTFDTSRSSGMFMFTDDQALSEQIANNRNTETARVLGTFLNIRNPKSFNMDGYDWFGNGVGENEGKSINKGRKTNFTYLEATKAKREGFDGTILNNVTDTGIKSNHYIVYSPTQIKSATDNVGTFSDNPSILFQTDTEYLDAVNSGDMAKAQDMVDQRAREQGYTIKAYHGSPETDITEFDISKAGEHTQAYSDKAFWFSDSQKFADDFAYEWEENKYTSFLVNKGKRGRLYSVDLKINKPFDLRNITPEMRDILFEGYKFSRDRAEFDRWLDSQIKARNHQGIKLSIDYNLLKEMGYDAVIANIDTLYNEQKGRENADAIEYGVFSPNQIKSADPVTYDDAGNVIPLSQRFNDSHSSLLFQSAYHGSGANFDKFDTAFMGTGEGAQAFGWGIYLTQSKGIAKGYAERMSSKYRGLQGDYDLYSNGNKIELPEFLNETSLAQSAKGSHELLRNDIRFLINFYNKEKRSVQEQMEGLDKLLKQINSKTPNFDKLVTKYFNEDNLVAEAIKATRNQIIDTLVTGNGYTNEQKINLLREQINWYKGNESIRIDNYNTRIKNLEEIDLDTFEARKTTPRNLYTVSIPDDTGSNYLYWDRPIGEEALEKIRNAYIPELVERNQDWLKKGTKEQIVQRVKSGMTFDRELASPEETGKQIYDDLIKLLGSDKDASEFLNRAGFVGIDYPANSMSGGNKYGKRNFVIFNADDITIDNHLMWQNKTPGEVENEMIAEAKGETLEDWLDFNRFLGDDNLDEEALKAIWEKANNVTETPDGAKIVNTENLTEEEKDNAFQAIIDSEDGVRRVIEDIRQAIQFKNEVYRTGASDEEEQGRAEAIDKAQTDLETTAAKIIKSVVFSKEKDIADGAVKSIQGIMRKNLVEYRELYSKFTGREELAMSNDALPFIDEPTRAAVATMTISQKRRYLEEVADEKLTESFLKGKELNEGETERVIAHLKETMAEKDNEIAEARAELSNATKRISSRDQMLLKEVSQRETLESQVNKLSAKIRAKLDKGNKISEEEYRKLNTAQEKLDNINEMLKELRKQDKTKEALKWSEKLDNLKAEQKWNEKRLRAARKLHEYKGKLHDYIMHKVSKNVNWEQAEEIKAIQAAFGTTTGYDTEYIILKGKRMKLAEFREGVKNGTVSIDGLTDYQKNRLFNLSLADYTVEELEYLAEAVRYLTQKGRQEWQAKVDARNYEAKQWQTLMMNQIARSPRYTNASDTPLPGTAEDIKKERNLLQMIRTGWFKTLNMARKAQMLDGDRKAVAYRLLVEEYRDHLRNELEAIRRRQKPVQDLMEKLGVKPEDFYNDTYRLNIGGHEQTYNLSQIIYGVKAQMEQRNMEAFVYGNLFNANEKPEGVNRLWLEKQGETRLAEFNRQAQEILKGKENIMKVADAIWADWQNRDNFNRLNQAAIEEYNQAVDPVAFYMPIARLDFNGTELASKIADDLYNQNAGKGMTSVEKGMIKSRITIAPENQMPIDMDYFKLWNESVNDQEHFIETNAYIRKLNRVFKARGSKDLKATIENVFGQGMMNDINNYINEIANPDTNTDTQGVNKFITFLRGALYPAYLAFKASSVILQMITSPAPFLREVGPLELVKGLVQMSLHPVETWRYVSGLSAIMENRSMNPMVEEAKKAAQRYTDPKYKRLWHKIQEKGTMGLEMADKWSVTAGWLAVFTKQKDKLIAEGMEEAQAEREAVKYADNVVLETQPTGDKAELAPLFKVGGPAWQAFTQFQVSLNVIWNNLSYDVLFSDRINHEKRKAMGTLIGYAMAGMILYATQEGFDDDDDAEDVILKLLYGATTQYTSSIPLVSSSIDNMIRARMTGDNWISKSNQLYPGFDALMQGVTNLDWKKVVRGAAIMGGVPMSGWKEFEHSFYNRKTGELRFYPQAFLGRRETNKKK